MTYGNLPTRLQNPLYFTINRDFFSVNGRIKPISVMERQENA